MPREVIVAGENREETRKKWAFHAKVSAALTRKGRAVDQVDWEAVERLRHEGLTPAAAAKKAPMKVIDPAPCDCGVVPAAAPADSGFSKVVKDEAKFAALLARAKEVGPLDNDRGMYRFIRADLEKQDQEIFYVVGLDSHNGLRCVSEVARGQRDRVAVDVADVLRVVLIEGCKGFAVAHNHPAGNPVPSASDKTLTAKLEAAAPKVGVIFLDHLVIGSGSYYSFRDKKTKKG
jgi:DNA repair protein RadC